jgi:hypothetical protein
MTGNFFEFLNFNQSFFSTQPVSSIINIQFSISLDSLFNYIIDGLRSKMTLNYWAIVEKYPFPNGVVGGLIFRCQIFLYLIKKN